MLKAFDESLEGLKVFINAN